MLCHKSGKAVVCCAVSLRSRLAEFLYDFLDVGKAPRPADAIFVMAGRQDPKIHGIRMWRYGYAPQLILSIGRSEWDRFGELKLHSDGGLQALAERTPEKKRHFFVRFDRQDAFCRHVTRNFWGTRSEARALAEYVKELSVRSLLVVSSPAHMRRTALSFRRAFRKSGINLTFVSVQERISFEDSRKRSEIWAEFLRCLFSLPLP